MRLVRLGLANVNSTVGAVQENVDRAVHLAKQLAEKKIHFAAFPEQMIGGYSAEDLVHWQAFLHAQLIGLGRFANQTAACKTMYAVGFLLQVRGQVYNCAALVFHGRIWGICPKEKLPLYHVFYEGRTLSRGIPFHYEELDLQLDSGQRLLGPGDGLIPFGDLIFRCGFGIMALEVCEDIWSPDGPMRRRCFSGAELVANLSASPFQLGITETRREMINTRSSDNLATILYANTIGANDGLVFDGGGYVSQNGRTLLSGTRFREGFDVVTIDLDRTSRARSENTTFRWDCEEFNRQGKRAHLIDIPNDFLADGEIEYPIPKNRSFFLPIETLPASPKQQFCEELLHVLTLGLGDYFEKTKAFRCIGLALSGGRDSLLCLLLAHRYLKKKYEDLPIAEQKKQIKSVLFSFYMPSKYSSSFSQKAAQITAEALGINLLIIPLEDAIKIETEAAQNMLPAGEFLNAVTLQNIQARIRGERMWNWANATNGFFLQTSNMSEKAVGYTTIGGDMMGCFSPIANLPKTVVNYLLAYVSEQPNFSFIQEVLSRPSSAELEGGQETERDLMPFQVLDSCIALFVGEKMHPLDVTKILAQMFPEYSQEELKEWVLKFTKLFTQSIYKWVQFPLAIHVGNLDLDRERALQLPVVSNNNWMTMRK